MFYFLWPIDICKNEQGEYMNFYCPKLKPKCLFFSTGAVMFYFYSVESATRSVGLKLQSCLPHSPQLTNKPWFCQSVLSDTFKKFLIKLVETEHILKMHT